MKKTYLLLIVMLFTILHKGQVNFSIYNLSPTYSITCSNPSVNLLATSASAGTYFWASNTGTYTGSNVVINTPGTFTVTFTSGNTISTQTLYVGTNVLVPTMTLTPTFQNITCSISSVNSVTVSSSGGANVTQYWYSPQGGVSVNTNTSISIYPPGTPGTYTAVVVNNISGCATAKTFTVSSSDGFPTFSLVSTPGGYSLGCNASSITVSIVNANTYPINGGPVSFTLLTPSSNTVLPPGNLGAQSAFTISQPGNYTAITRDNSNLCASRSHFSVIQNTVPPAVHLIPTSTISCVGSTVALTAYGASNYTFTPAISNGVPFTVTSPGTYSVSTTSTVNNCIGTATAFINLLPPVSLTLSPQNTNVCVGSTIALTAIGADQYSWTGGITNGVVFTPTASGNYSVTATNTLNGCQATSVQAVTLYSLPVITISASSYSVCQGVSVTLTASGADIFNWTGGITNGIPFVPTASGTYTVTGTNTLAGCSSSNSVHIGFLAQAPTIGVSSSEPVFCAGMSTTLSASGASNYLWSNQSTSSSIVVQPVFPTTYSVTGSNPGSCSTTVIYTLVPDTSTKFNYTISAMVLNLQLTGIGCNSFTWFIDNQSSSINTNPVITFTNAGVHSVCLQCNGLPSACARCFNVKAPGFGAGGVGLTEIFTTETFNIFPNPAHDKLHLNAPSGDYSIRISSILGTEVMNAHMLNGENEIYLKLEDGLYLYTIFSDITPVISGKLVVRH